GGSVAMDKSRFETGQLTAEERSIFTLFASETIAKQAMLAGDATATQSSVTADNLNIAASGALTVQDKTLLKTDTLTVDGRLNAKESGVESATVTVGAAGGVQLDSVYYEAKQTTANGQFSATKSTVKSQNT